MMINDDDTIMELVIYYICACVWWGVGVGVGYLDIWTIGYNNEYPEKCYVFSHSSHRCCAGYKLQWSEQQPRLHGIGQQFEHVFHVKRRKWINM